jgi:putative Holliday junction resolvase
MAARSLTETSPLESARAPHGAILAIDYGRKRLGLALSDALGVLARPLAVWARTNRRRDVARLRELCRLHGATRIVVGWPLRLDGSRGEMADEAARFAEQLRKHLCLPVELADERLSSWEAGQITNEAPGGGRASRGPRKTTDDVAAAVILRDYLSRSRGAA